MQTPTSPDARPNRLDACLLALVLVFLSPASGLAAFGLSSATDYYTIDTGAGLVFKVRRTDNGVSTQSAGDIMSLVYNGVEYQDQSRGSQVNSGCDYLYTGISAVAVSAAVVNTDYIKVTVVAGDLTHYYMARRGYPHIYMATYFVTEPQTEALCRYIVRIPSTSLPNGPTPSDNRNTDFTVESSDIFGFSSTNSIIALRGQTRAKHYSNMRLKDWSYIGATGANVGIWIVRDNNEGNSGGPFFRCLLNQCGSDQEITYIVNYGETLTEAFRTGILNSYTLVCTNGAAPAAVDTSWFANMSLVGYIAPAARGSVTCSGITGRDTSYAYTVGFSNSTAQYWTDAAAGNGSFNMTGMIPGTYTMSVYKNEYVVYSNTNVAVTASGTTTLSPIAITADPSRTVPLWRIGNWDGTPNEFLNADKVTTMHPSDVRISTWSPGTYVIGTSSPATGMPCYQWKDVGGGYQTVQFTLTAGQLVASTVRVGITTAYAGGRPNISVNSWTASLQGPSTQPNSRTLTVGSYRGNNTTYTFSVPASALVAGTNTLTIYPISGTSGTGYLSPGYSLDAIDMYQGTANTLAIPNAPASLTETAGNAQVALSWTASAGAASYIIQRGTTSGGPYTPVANANSTSYTDSGLTNKVTYYYIVSGSNSSGVGLSSAEASAKPNDPPAVPTGLTATPGNTQISLTWTASSGATSYNVKRSLINGGPYTTIASSGTATGYVDTGLVNSTTYYYVVSALKNASESLDSIQASNAPVGPPQIAYLRFDESSGVTASDSTGNGWNGTLVNGPIWTTGTNAKINNAVSLDGTNDHITLPTGVVSGLNDFTISAWVKLNAVSTWSRIFDFGTSTTNYLFLTPKNGGTNTVRFAIRTNSVAEQQIDGLTALTTGTWTHVAVTLSGSTGTLYVTGVAVKTNPGMSLSPSSLGSTNLNYIGRSQFSADPYLNGLVDEFQIYNRALSASEIAALAAPPSAPTGLAATPANNQITLNWNATNGATGYNLKRATTSGGPYAIVATSLTGTSYTNVSLTNLTTYYYVVTAANGVAESANSSEASAKPGLSYSQWTSAAFPGQSDPAIIGNNADPDSDGVKNLVEFFEGTNPASSNANPPIQCALDGLDNAVLTFRMAKNLIGISYSIDQSPDLNNWTSTGLQGTPTDMGSYYLMKVTIPLGSNTKLFFRLSVTPGGS